MAEGTSLLAQLVDSDFMSPTAWLVVGFAAVYVLTRIWSQRRTARARQRKGNVRG